MVYRVMALVAAFLAAVTPLMGLASVSEAAVATRPVGVSVVGPASARLGRTFQIAVRMDTGGNALDGVEARVRYNPALLRVVDSDPRKPGKQVAVGSCAAALSVVLANSANTSGDVFVALGRALAVNGKPVTIRRSCSMATITFAALRPGKAELSLYGVEAAAEGERIPVATNNATVVIRR